MRSHLAIRALGVLAVVAGVMAPVEAQSRTTYSGLSRRVGTDAEVCGVINGPVVISAGLGAPSDFGNINMCACLSFIRDILEMDPVASLAAQDTGIDVVTNLLTNWILSVGTPCVYPPGSIQTCDMNDPCAYTCPDGFSVSTLTRQCVCEPPNVVCATSGQCTASCPSAIAVTEDRRRRAAQVSAFDRVANRRRMCPRGFTPCGIFEQRGQVGEPWDCVDIRHELESCGGCMTPFDSSSPRGVDCTAIPGVADVSCMRGTCVVRRCMSGYAVTPGGSQCVPTR